MTQLDYQSPGDRKYERTGILRKLFGPSQAEIWNQLAQQLDAKFVPSSVGKPARVEASVDEWTVTIDTFTDHQGESSQTYTRFRAPYVNRDDFRFTIYPASFFTAIGKALGMQDIEVGYQRFDDAMVVKGQNESRVRLLLQDRDLCDAILWQDNLRIDVRDNEGWFGPSFPENVDELRFTIHGTIKDLNRLRTLFDLFARMLHRLCAIGSAYEDDPKVSLQR